MVDPLSILGALSAAIELLKNCKRLYDAAHSARKLYEPFAKVAENIPVVLDILQNAETILSARDEKFKHARDVATKRELESTEESVKSIIATCYRNSDQLYDIFQRVMREDDMPLFQRYKATVRSLKPGREQMVVGLMQEIRHKIELLHLKLSFEAAANSRQRSHRLRRLYHRCLYRLRQSFRTLATARKIPIQASEVNVPAVSLGTTTTKRSVWTLSLGVGRSSEVVVGHMPLGAKIS